MISQHRRVAYKNLQVSVELRNEVSLRKVANHGVNRLTVLEEDEGRDGDDAETSCKICFVINVSSPNTPNLRELQEESFIKDLFARLSPIAKKPIIFKIAPDMDDDKAVQICKTAVESGAKGVIVNNTSVDYSLSKSANLQNFGGLSGKVIAKRSRELFSAVASELYGKTVLIASGGIDSAEEAYARIKSGANLVQIYTSFIFKGPNIAKQINEGILKLLKEDNFASISEAVGCDIKNKI